MIAQPRPFQFSLRTLFLVTTALAVVCSGLFAGPPWATLLTASLLAMLTPLAFTVAVVYGRGYLRTFCIGGLFPCAPLFLFFCLYCPEIWASPAPLLSWSSIFIANPEARLYVGIVSGTVITAILVSGLFAMGVRWVIERSQRTEVESPASTPEASPGNGGDGPGGSLREP